MSIDNPFDLKSRQRLVLGQAPLAEKILGGEGLDILEELVDGEEVVDNDIVPDEDDFAFSEAEAALHEALMNRERLFDDAIDTIAQLTPDGQMRDYPLDAKAMLIAGLYSASIADDTHEQDFYAEIDERRGDGDGIQRYLSGHAVLLSGNRPLAEELFNDVSDEYRYQHLLATFELLEDDFRRGIISEKQILKTFNILVRISSQDGTVPSYVLEQAHHFLRRYSSRTTLDISPLFNKLKECISKRDRSDDSTNPEYSVSTEALNVALTAIQLGKLQDIEELMPSITYHDHPTKVKVALADHAAQGGDFIKARSLFTEVLKTFKNSTDLSICEDMVRIALALPGPIQALLEIENAVNQDHGGFTSHTTYAALVEGYMKQGQKGPAERCFNKIEREAADLEESFKHSPFPFKHVTLLTALARASWALGLDPQPPIKTLQERFVLPNGDPHPAFAESYVIPDWHAAAKVSIEFDVDPTRILHATKTLLQQPHGNKDLFEVAKHQIAWATHAAIKVREAAKG